MNDAPATAPDGAAPATGARTVVGNRIDFSAQLDSFQGPLDLLLYLIKENEVEITEIPISMILEQYLRFLDNADQWDLQLAGEFLVMAATLMEIKSRDLLPVQEQPTEGEEIIEDPRSELVRQLLQYRKLKEQAKLLEQLQDSWAEMRPRGFFGDVPEPSDEENPEADRATARDALVDVDIYGLFAAYERILKSVLAQTPRNIIFERRNARGQDHPHRNIAQDTSVRELRRTGRRSRQSRGHRCDIRGIVGARPPPRGAIGAGE